jgi:poly-gamma-glutamate synthesis protein (capsule biosynthesis protein)
MVGDVLVNRHIPHEVFREVREILQAPQILFANLEAAYTDFPRPAPGAPAVVSAPASNLDVFSDVGFNVMSLANNHILDVGAAAMLETRARLRARGVQTCGAGESLADAHRPAILEAGGLRIAFLAYASIFPVGHEAQADKPGLASLRAYNKWWGPYPNYHAPGMLPLVATTPDPEDLERLADDIRFAREQADLVVTSFHWGDQTCPFHLTDHETRTARFCVDHGVQMVIGHHHHALRGIEWYKGKPILYGLGHFAFDFPMEWSEPLAAQFSSSEIGRHYRRIQYGAGPRRGWPLLPFPEDARMTMVCWASANKGGVSAISVIPCRLDASGVIHPVRLDSPEGREFLAYLHQCNETQDLHSSIVSEGSPAVAGFATLRVVPR